jgi:hypothetical protein
VSGTLLLNGEQAGRRLEDEWRARGPQFVCSHSCAPLLTVPRVASREGGGATAVQRVWVCTALKRWQAWW